MITMNEENKKLGIMPGCLEANDIRYSYCQLTINEFLEELKHYEEECNHDEMSDNNHHDHSNSKEFDFMDFIVFR